jgi:hypothetical protein
MDIDQAQILGSDSVSDGTLASAINFLEESLPACRRELAYGLANLRRIEQKYEQTRDEIIRQDQALVLAKSNNDLNGIQIILGDRLQNTQAIGKLKHEYDGLTHKAEALKDKISTTESQIHKLQAKRKNLKTKIQASQRRKYYYMALGVIDSTFLLNAIEYPVIQESILQHSQLSMDVRIKFKPIEVAAFALNRLPSMYVSTMDDYHQHLRITSGDMKLRITETVKRSIQTLRMGDPLRDSTPLPDEVFCEPSGILGSLFLAFNRKDLRWSDVPKLLLKIKEQRSPSEQSISQATSSTTYVRQSQVSHVQMYLQRSKLRKNNYENDEGNSSKNLKIEDKFLELYTLRSKFKYVNVIEKLVVVQALLMGINIFDQSSNYAEILTHTLNKHMPMYTTSERGINRLCKEFFEIQVESVNTQISKSSVQFRGQAPRKASPLYFQQFNQEYINAMPEIATILNRQDLTPENLVNVITDFVTGKF